MQKTLRAQLVASLAIMLGLLVLVAAVGLWPAPFGPAGVLIRFATIVAAVGIAIIVGLSLVRAVAPISTVAETIESIAGEATNLEAVAIAQANLELNLSALRDLLYKHGDPQVVETRLMFGAYTVNGSNEFVDKVQVQHGGSATIFLGDTRISTNIKDASGNRQIGTKLASGPAHDALFANGKTYRGVVDIFGEAFITIYEPVVAGNAIIGAIFVAVRKAETVAAGDAGASQPPACSPARMLQTLDTIRLVTQRRDQAMGAANEQRSNLTDARRKQKAVERVATKAQENVVAALSTALERLAGSDLTHVIEAAFPPEYQKLKDDFAAALEALRRAMCAISDETHTMHDRSVEIAEAVDDLSRRTEKQAASLEETAASLDQITVAVKKTAKGVDDARRVVTSTKSTAEDSSAVMREAVTAMSQIQKSSQQIAQIVGLIDSIAFQTNLLALNAGVEAARAGEGGRGFAVVAAEVRALAQRSAEAAREIKDLIEASSQHVKQGVSLIGRGGKSLDLILSQVNGVSEIVLTIAASAEEQALSLQEINVAVTQMDQFTQQNAAMVEETTAASHDLAQEAAALERLVGNFRTGVERAPSHGEMPRRRLGVAA